MSVYGLWVFRVLGCSLGFSGWGLGGWTQYDGSFTCEIVYNLAQRWGG